MRVVLIMIFMVSCITKSVKKTNELMPGMTVAQVKQRLGTPTGSGMSNQGYYLKYELHQDWKGYVPHYFYFNKENKLYRWGANMNEFHQKEMINSAAWSQLANDFDNMGQSNNQVQQQPQVIEAPQTCRTQPDGLGGFITQCN